uniref:(northern house mosquito) hypothetical protein n=2 Tax=Culex pipiens TaxID=7175 RepID=A0A8D8C175_CULPI
MAPSTNQCRPGSWRRCARHRNHPVSKGSGSPAGTAHDGTSDGSVLGFVPVQRRRQHCPWGKFRRNGRGHLEPGTGPQESEPAGHRRQLFAPGPCRPAVEDGQRAATRGRQDPAHRVPQLGRNLGQRHLDGRRGLRAAGNVRAAICRVRGQVCRRMLPNYGAGHQADQEDGDQPVRRTEHIGRGERGRRRRSRRRVARSCWKAVMNCYYLIDRQHN